MNEVQVKDLIAEIPTLLEYFIPGYCAVFFYRKINNATKKDGMSEQIHIGTCIIISYFIKLIFDGISSLPCLPDITVDAHISCILKVLFACLGAAILTKAMRSRWTRKWYGEINSTTLSPTVFECCDLDKGNPMVSVFTDDGGRIDARLLTYDDDPSEDRWLAVDRYAVYDKKDRLIDHWTRYDHYTRRLISYAKIISIEAHYEKNAGITPSNFTTLRKENMVK